MKPDLGTIREASGRRPPSMSGAQISEIVCRMGWFEGTPEQFWNLSRSGELFHVFEAEYEILVRLGYRMQVLQSDGTWGDLVRVPFGVDPDFVERVRTVAREVGVAA